MIYYVSGPVTVLEPGLAVIECGGVGYGCRVTAYTAGQLKLNQNARLYITESIREDAFDLYGFISKEEQRCYELLTSVNGVGPKAAMAILSSGGPQNFTLAVMTSFFFSAFLGVKRTASASVRAKQAVNTHIGSEVITIIQGTITGNMYQTVSSFPKFSLAHFL